MNAVVSGGFGGAKRSVTGWRAWGSSRPSRGVTVRDPSSVSHSSRNLAPSADAPRGDPDPDSAAGASARRRASASRAASTASSRSAWSEMTKGTAWGELLTSTARRSHDWP